MSKLKIAVIGTGLVGTFHAEAFFRNPNSELVAVCDVDKEKVNSVAQSFNCKAYEDFTKLINTETLDAISIATPEQIRIEPAVMSVKKGLKILLEKPLGRNLEKINELNVLNPTIQSTKLIEAGNNLIEQDVKQAMEAISRAWNDKVNSLMPKQGEVSPTGTEFEKQTLEARRSGLTEKQAKDLALSTTLKGDETFDIVDEPGKPVEIDVSKPSKGLFNIGNYEIEDLKEYNLLFENTKATGAFKGNKKAVDEFFKNRKEIVKEGDFFEPLITKYNKYVNPSSDFYSFTPLAPDKNLTEIEFQTTRLTIDEYIVDNGVLAEDALKGDILGYPLKKLIQRNWDRMPIISEDTPEDVITDIWNKNGLGEDHKIINRAGQEVTQNVTREEFIAAQRKLITDQTK